MALYYGPGFALSNSNNSRKSSLTSDPDNTDKYHGQRFRVQLMSVFETDTQKKTTPSLTGLSFSKRGEYLIVDNANRCVMIFNRMGSKRSHFGSDVLKSPWNIVQISDNHYAVSDPGDNDIKIFTSDGDFSNAFHFGKNLQEPYGLAVASSGNIIVADRGARCIYLHNKDGFVERVTQMSDEDAALQWPAYIVEDLHGNLLVSDPEVHTLTNITYSAKTIFTYDGSLGEDVLLAEPAGVCLDESGHVFVADTISNSIHMLTTEGEFIGYIVSEKDGLQKPQALAIDSKGNIVVTERDSGLVKMFKYQDL